MTPDEALRSFLLTADDSGMVTVLGGPDARLPVGCGAAADQELCFYPVRTTTGISVKLTPAGKKARDKARATGGGS